jgi:uncharacterized protein (DUF58 family)
LNPAVLQATSADGARQANAVALQLRWAISAHARRLFYVAVAALATAVVARRPEFVAVAAPGLVLLSARRPRRPATAQVHVRLSAGRVYEGEQVVVDARVSGLGDHQVEMVLHAGEGVVAVGGADRAASPDARLGLQAELWGRRRAGALELVFSDRYRVYECRQFVLLPELAVYPRPAPHHRAAVLGRLANRSGDHMSRSAGEGAEFAGVREYVPGDRQRSINWGATTRRGRLQVNSFAAERSQDVVLIVDASTDVGEAGSTPVDHAMRGALGVARTYLEARDRVGLVLFGSWVSWVAPAMGQRQLYRLMETMLATRAGWPSGNDVSRLPRAALPAGASVVAFSPLLDMPFVEALRDLRQRNFPVVVVDVLNAEPRARRHRSDQLAQRVWRMERQALRFSLSQLGISVISWSGQADLSLSFQQRPYHGRRWP